jgi:pimeloyl-ACP methyl ester carboxylesterase
MWLVARLPTDDPFGLSFEVPVAGGELHVAQAGPPAREAKGVALAAHGMTPGLMIWRTVARRLHPDVCFLAPDLRGRGRSARLPGPYGMAAHVADLIAVLDYVGAPPVVLVGHSMGAYVAERLAADHPERAAAVVLLDSGLPFPRPGVDGEIVDLGVARGLLRLAITFPSADRCVHAWRSHPAVAQAWDEDVEAFVRYDLVEDRGLVRCGASPAAVRTDGTEMALDDANRTALDRVHTPVCLLRAERGLFDDDPIIPRDKLQAFSAAYPSVGVEEVAGVNHYTLVIGPGVGPHRVAAAIERFCGNTQSGPDQ